MHASPYHHRARCRVTCRMASCPWTSDTSNAVSTPSQEGMPHLSPATTVPGAHPQPFLHRARYQPNTLPPPFLVPGGCVETPHNHRPRCLVDVPGGKLPADLPTYLRDTVAPEVPQMLRPAFLQALNGNIRTMQNTCLYAAPLHQPGVSVSIPRGGHEVGEMRDNPPAPNLQSSGCQQAFC